MIDNFYKPQNYIKLMVNDDKNPEEEKELEEKAEELDEEG